MRIQRLLALGIALATPLVAICSDASSSAREPVRTIIMVWDGLRPDSVNPMDTPNLYALRQSGVNFTDHHSTYPTFTMMNGSSFATGSFPKTSGFYGNTFWTPPQGSSNTIPSGPTAAGVAGNVYKNLDSANYFAQQRRDAPVALIERLGIEKPAAPTETSRSVR